ncbi:MAG: hypothetical protein FJY97_14610 [candidate division Zixibacteria bacterium]|nr:hypothetical protein [candidate division Zixibacteria bacterium]
MTTLRGIGSVLVLTAFLAGCGNNMDSFQELVQELDETEQEIRLKQDDIRKKVQEYNRQHPDKPIDSGSLDRLMLDPAQEAELTRLLGAEQDVSYRGLVQQLVDARKQISDLQEQTRMLQEQLPAPYSVKRGDTHFEVAVRYLTQNHGLSAAEARKVVEQTALVEDLQVGFQVWMLYQEGVFGSYVTQGTAKVSPGRAQRLAKQRVTEKISTLTEERDTARSAADSLEEMQASLEERILFLRDEAGRLESEIAALRDSREEALAQIKMGEEQRRALEKKLNSLYYDLDTFDGWKSKRVISDPLFGAPRVESVSKIGFTKSQDLRESDTIAFDAAAFSGLRQIKSVEIYPRSFREGQEYTVSVDAGGSRAEVKILKPDLFAGQKVIFAVK